MNIINEPSEREQVGNPVYITVTSPNSSEDNYQYILDISRFSDGDILTRLRAEPHPETGVGIFEISGILRSLISYRFETIDDTSNLSLTSAYNDALVRPLVAFAGESYIDSDPEVGYVENLNQSNTAFSIMNVQQPYHKFVKGTIEEQYPNEVFFTDVKSMDIYENEHAYLTSLTRTSPRASSIRLRTFDNSGSQVGHYDIENRTHTNDQVALMYVGTAQLANSNDYTVLSGNNDIINDNVSYYTIRKHDGDNEFGETIRYNIKKCGRFSKNKVRIHFLSEIGSFGSYTFDMKNRKFISTNKEQYQRPKTTDTGTNINFTSTGGGYVDYRSESTELLRLNSDWMSQKEMDWYSQMISSPVIFVESEEYGVVRGRIRSNEMEVSQKVNDKLISMQIDVEIANKTIRT